jgi:hypothetical protein
MIVPILATDSSVFVASGSSLSAYPTTCTRPGQRCRPAWVAHVSGWIDSIALAGDAVYVGSSPGSAPPVSGTLSVFPQACSHRCRPSSEIPIAGGGNPTVADGVLYVGWVRGVSAFAAGCGESVGPCTPLWETPAHVGPVSAPTVAGGVLYAPTEDGRVFAFAPGGTARLPGQEAPSRRPSAWYGAFYAAVFALAAGVVLLRRNARAHAKGGASTSNGPVSRSG